MDTQEKEWYTAQEAAQYLGINMDRLAHLRRTGRIKAITGGGEHTRYSMYHINDLKSVDTGDYRKKEYREAHEQRESDDDSTNPQYHSWKHGNSTIARVA